jgi:hypothetical protein
MQISTDRLDGLLLSKIGLADFRNRLHNQHLELGLLKVRRPVRALIAGSRLDADYPENGVLNVWRTAGTRLLFYFFGIYSTAGAFGGDALTMDEAKFVNAVRALTEPHDFRLSG